MTGRLRGLRTYHVSQWDDGTADVVSYSWRPGSGQGQAMHLAGFTASEGVEADALEMLIIAAQERLVAIREHPV